MTAREFWKDFSSLFKDGSPTRDEAIKKWHCYTDFIIGKMRDILKNHGLETEKEYYKIDLIGYKQLKDKEKIGGYLKQYKWGLEVAIEHENNDKTWMDEVVKLLHIYCPLRVLIGYLPKSKEKDHIEILSEMNNKIRDLNAYKNLENGEFLIILGNGKCNDVNDFCRYKAYIYDKGNFKALD